MAGMARKANTREKPGPPKTRRGERTRARLMQAAEKVLEDRAYAQIRLEDIANEADTPVSLFYHYFADKKALYLELIEDWADAHFRELDHLLDQMIAQKAANPGPGALFDTVYGTVHRQVQEWARRPGLFRCLMQCKDTEPEFGAAYRSRVKAWNDRHTDRLKRRFPDASIDRGLRTGIIYATYGTTERLLFSLFCTPDAGIATGLRNEAEIARLLTIGYCRMIYLHNPTAAQLDRFAGITDLDRAPAAGGRG